LKRILPAHHGFQRGEIHILFQIDLFMRIEETLESLERKPSTLDGGASSTLLPYEN
jgi:hypothetical protein